MIQFNKVNYTYEVNNPIELSSPHTLKDISLFIDKGEYIAVIGANGSGKSTLAKLMNGLLLPIEGSVQIDGLESTNLKEIWQIRRKVGMIFQNPENQIVATTVLDDIAFGLENIGVASAEMKSRAREALAKVNMQGFDDVEPYQLSGGQKQRVAIAGIVAMKPDAIIFDEATSMLDPEGRKSILAIMKQLHKEGLTIITITHDMNEAMEAERVLLIDQGKLVEDLSTEEMLQKEEIYEAYHLEMSFLMKLKNSLREHGLEIPASIKNEKEMVEYLCKLG